MLLATFLEHTFLSVFLARYLAFILHKGLKRALYVYTNTHAMFTTFLMQMKDEENQM